MMRAHTIIPKDFSVRFYSIMWPMILTEKRQDNCMQNGAFSYAS